MSLISSESYDKAIKCLEQCKNNVLFLFLPYFFPSYHAIFKCIQPFIVENLVEWMESGMFDKYGEELRELSSLRLTETLTRFYTS